MGMLSSNTGKRNHEETYTIAADTPKIETYYGRSNLKNTDPTAQKDPHAMDYIFCPACEGKLSTLESYCIPILNSDVRDEKKAGNFPVTNTKGSFYYKTCVNENYRRFTLFLYSIVWRQCLQQRVATGTRIISEEFDEGVRLILSQCLSTDLSSIDECQIIDQLPPYSIITQEELEDATKNAVNPFQRRSNPSLFFVNSLNVLVYWDGLENKTLSIDGLDEDIMNSDIVNTASIPIKVYFTSKVEWDLMRKATYSILAKQMLDNLAKRIQNCKGLGYIEARNLLTQEAHKIFKENQEQIGFGNCCLMAADKICASGG
jgi:hypothetical protein